MSLELKNRTKVLGIRVIKMVREIKTGKVEDVITRQIIRSAVSIDANYRSSLRGKSLPDFISKLKIAEEEADETCYWLEIMIEIGIFEKKPRK